MLNERKIPWLVIDANDKVHLTYGFVEAVRKGTYIKDSMRTLAELLNWKYGSSTVRSAGFNGKNITVTMDNST